jgi:hypothetical protein
VLRKFATCSCCADRFCEGCGEEVLIRVGRVRRKVAGSEAKLVRTDFQKRKNVRTEERLRWGARQTIPKK